MNVGTLVTTARPFLEWYEGVLPQLSASCHELAVYLTALISDENINVHVVGSRAKTIEGIRAKLLRKRYNNPKRQLTDRIAARVILYHARDVDRVAEILRSHISVIERHSTDKRQTLGLREFGYRSYHLIGRIPQHVGRDPRYKNVAGETVEIQIRSLLEHAWAEIEHGVIYKSGARFPDRLRRRFAAMAGVLELLEHEFQQLIAARDALVDEAAARLLSEGVPRKAVDVPTMLAICEILLPDGISFRKAEASRNPFPEGLAQRFVLALRAAGIRTQASLKEEITALQSRKLRRKYATEEGIPEAEVSHVAALALVLAMRRPALFNVYFPEFAADLSIMNALKQH